MKKMDTWDFFYLLTNRNQRKPFSAPNCSNKRKKTYWRWKRIITKKTKQKKQQKKEWRRRCWGRWRGDGGWKEGRHRGSEVVALFCLMLRQAIFKGKQVGDWKRVKNHMGRREGTKSEDAGDHFFFPPTPEVKKGRTLMCLSRLKSVFNVCLCSFSK